jgi:hypothetical protein
MSKPVERHRRDWEHEKHLKPSRKWSEPLRPDEVTSVAFPIHDSWFAAARRDSVCLRRNVGGKARRVVAHCRLHVLWSYFMIYFIVTLRINSAGIRNMLAEGSEKSWAYLYNFHEGVKEGITRF